MKGVYPHEELGQLPKAAKVKTIVPLQVPGLEAQRHLVILNSDNHGAMQS